MYNSIYPININYRNKGSFYKKTNPNPAANQDTERKNLNQASASQTHTDTFPNGTKVAIDYTKGQINISQVITDFKSTIIAINAPDDVKEEVNTYLSLTEKEALKENPSRDIIIANLKNASKVSDDYIARTLGKNSNVVSGWIDALFLQKINIKADPKEINPDFLLEFPEKAKERIDEENKKAQGLALSEQPSSQNERVEQAFVNETSVDEIPQTETVTASEMTVTDTDEAVAFTDEQPRVSAAVQTIFNEDVQIANALEMSDTQNAGTPKNVMVRDNIPVSPFYPKSEADKAARLLFVQAKNTPKDNKGDTESLNLLNEALGILANDSDSNQNIRAAIHLERGKIFDNYDYVDYALRDYWEATKATDLNLKANAYYKTGSIYDEFSEFSPALSNYLSSVAYSGEADNPKAQAQALSRIAELYSKRYDADNFSQYSDLAVESALNSENNRFIAETYSTFAQNYGYLGNDDKALEGYKNALAVFSREDESYEQMAYNYEQASLVMKRLGNPAKAAKLQAKANLYYQKALQQQGMLKEAS